MRQEPGTCKGWLSISEAQPVIVGLYGRVQGSGGIYLSYGHCRGLLCHLSVITETGMEERVGKHPVTNREGGDSW